MTKIHLVMAQRNTQLLENLSSFIRNSHFSNKFIVVSFSNMTKLEEYLSTKPEIDILLLELDIHVKSVTESIFTIYLTENMMIEEGKKLILFTYQPLDQLFTKVIKLYLEKNPPRFVLPDGNRKTKIISFYSAVGGCGKSTMAINLAQQMTTFDEKVLYLNLELLASTNHFLHVPNTYDFSKLIYYVKTKSKQLCNKLEEFKQSDTVTKIDYYEPCINLFEIEEMTGEDVQHLINSIIETKIFDFVLIDLDSSTHERNLQALESSDLIYWLVGDNKQFLSKTKVLIEELQKKIHPDSLFKNNIQFVHSQYNGIIENQFDSYGITKEYKLPYIQEWKAISDYRQLLASTVFSEEIFKLYQSLVQDFRSEITC